MRCRDGQHEQGGMRRRDDWRQKRVKDWKRVLVILSPSRAVQIPVEPCSALTTKGRILAAEIDSLSAYVSAAFQAVVTLGTFSLPTLGTRPTREVDCRQ